MLVTLGWMLLTGASLTRPTTGGDVATATYLTAAGRVTLWTDRDEPYVRGQAVRVYLGVNQPSHLAVFRVDTDGRIEVLFPREPWTDTYVGHEREFELIGSHGGGSFLVDDDPGMGYLFALASEEPLDFRDITRGDSWDYRVVGGGRIKGDPYVALTDLAARIAPGGNYDYDIAAYYVDRRYEYPRFVCYDCHAYAGYTDWDPYRTPCTRYRVIIHDDPRYYPYRYGGGNVVTARPAHPGPRFVFRDENGVGRTSQDVGGRGAVPPPGVPSFRRREGDVARQPSAAHPQVDERRRPERRREQAPERDDAARDAPGAVRPTTPAPRSTGEPELRRRRP